MGKVKKDSKGSESFSKTPKKSHGAVQSIKSPIVRKQSIKSVSPTPLKFKKSKNENKNVAVPTIIKQENTKKGLTEHKQNKSKRNDIQNIKKDVTDFETKFNIKIEDVKSAIEGVIKLHSDNPKVKNQLFEDEPFPISLTVNCHKIPTGNQKILRIPLSHSLLTPDDDVCLFVSEVPGIGNKEHEKHIEHYENLFAKKGVTNIKKIMTVHEFVTEYETYEQKLRLADLYEYFIVCGKVSGKVVKKCGKVFYQKRKVPTSVRLQVPKLKEHIDKQLSKAFFHIHLKGNSYCTDFGSSKMEITKIVENFVSVVEYLDKEFPGGFANIKGLHITAPRAPSIPVYMSIKNSNEIPNVRVQHKNDYKPKAVRGEITTQLDAEVIVKPSGQVTVIRENKTGNAKKRPHPVTEENNETINELENIPIKKPKSEKDKSQKGVSEEKLNDNTVGEKIKPGLDQISLEELLKNKSKTKNKKMKNLIENTATEEHCQKEKNKHTNLEQNISGEIPNKKSKITNKKLEIENNKKTKNAATEENSQKEKNKHKNLEQNISEEIPNKKIKITNKKIETAIKNKATEEHSQKKKNKHKNLEQNISEEIPIKISKITNKELEIEKKNKNIVNGIENTETEENSQKKKNKHKNLEQNISEGIPNKKNKTTNKKLEIENKNTPIKENSHKLKKHKIVEIETDEVIKRTKSAKKIQKIKHLNNSIIIEDLSSSPMLTITNHETAIYQTRKPVRKGGNKKNKKIEISL